MKKIMTLLSLSILLGFQVGAAELKSTSKLTTVPNKTKKVSGESGTKMLEGKVQWTGYGVGKSHTGTIDIKSGEAVFEGGVMKSGKFVLDMTTLKSPDSERLTGHLKNPDFFEVEKYPEASFVSTSVEPIKDGSAGEANYRVNGDLTIKEIKKPLTILAKVARVGKGYEGTADVEIPDRTVYGIKYNSKQYAAVSVLGDKLIEDQIKFHVDLKTK